MSIFLTMDISIIIPVYEESNKIAHDIHAAAAFLELQLSAGEIIIVDDGSKDNTAAVASNVEVAPEITRHVIRYQEHRGKGCAVRTGIKNSSGDIVMFVDSGLCVPYANALSGLRMIKNGICDIAHGSRLLPGSKIVKPHRWSRQFSSWLFRKLLKVWMHIPADLTDTQCGFKMYQGEIARALYNQCTTDGFMFDIEIILRALKQGYRIKEFPIDWTADHDSRLSQMRMPLHVLSELRRLKKQVCD